MKIELKTTSDRIQKALDFATKAHAGVFRKGKDKDPYVYHPIEVATLIQKYHPDNENAIIGALLHDTVEDCEGVTFEVIEKEFGKEIADIIKDVTDDESDLQDLPRDELKDVRRQRQVDELKNICFDAQLIRLGDKTSNVRDLASADKSIEWKHKYFNFVERVYTELKDLDSPMVTVLREKLSETEKGLANESSKGVQHGE